MELVEPSTVYKDSFIAAVGEFQAEDDYTHRNQWYRKLSIPELKADFDAFVSNELGHSRGENLLAGYVPYSDFWLVHDGKFIGHATIRHRLNEQLLRIGGHIGYDIRPSERKKGYGKEMLRLALQKAKQRGIEKVLVTCDVRNVASKKIIEKNGGVLENQIPNPEMGHDALRFWITL